MLITFIYNLGMNNEASELIGFFTQSRQYNYKAGEVILRPEDTPSGVYYIEKGFVKVCSITRDGDEKLHVIYKTGEFFPLIWVFSNVTKNVFYEALGEVFLRRRSKEEFLEFLRGGCTKGGCPALFELVVRIIGILDVHVSRIDNLELTKAYPRLVARLLLLAKRFGKKQKNNIVIDVPITHKDIADSINMTRETASREIEVLEKKGLIYYQAHLIVIKDIDKLEKELSAHYERELL